MNNRNGLLIYWQKTRKLNDDGIINESSNSGCDQQLFSFLTNLLIIFSINCSVYKLLKKHYSEIIAIASISISFNNWKNYSYKWQRKSEKSHIWEAGTKNNIKNDRNDWSVISLQVYFLLVILSIDTIAAALYLTEFLSIKYSVIILFLLFSLIIINLIDISPFIHSMQLKVLYINSETI